MLKESKQYKNAAGEKVLDKGKSAIKMPLLLFPFLSFLYPTFTFELGCTFL